MTTVLLIHVGSIRASPVDLRTWTKQDLKWGTRKRKTTIIRHRETTLFDICFHIVEKTQKDRLLIPTPTRTSLGIVTTKVLTLSNLILSE